MEEMNVIEDSKVVLLRKSARERLQTRRKYTRDIQADSGRDYQREPTDQEIEDIAKKFKQNAKVTSTDLRTLKNAIHNNTKINYGRYVTNYSMLTGLIREVTGKDTDKQIEALGCLCNLVIHYDMGPATCAILVKNTAPYILSCISTINSEFTIIGLWTISNIASSGSRTCEALLPLAVIEKTCQIAESNPGDDVAEAVINVLECFVYYLEDGLSIEHLRQIVSAATHTTHKNVWKLIFLISCHKLYCDVLDQKLVTKILNQTYQCLDGTRKGKNLEELNLLIRALANSCITSEQSYFVKKHLQGHYEKLLQLTGSQNLVLKESILWLLGNLVKS